MGLQQRLIEMLGESFEVEREGADVLILKPRGSADGAQSMPPVRLLAAELRLADYAGKNATDGLAALGEVGGDTSGALAALAHRLHSCDDDLVFHEARVVRVSRAIKSRQAADLTTSMTPTEVASPRTSGVRGVTRTQEALTQGHTPLHPDRPLPSNRRDK